MLTEDELLKTTQLCAENKEFAHILRRYQEENQIFISSLTHELRNPLTIIQSTMQLMASRNPEITQIKYWGQITEDIKGLASLLKDLSTYSHCNKLNIEKTNLVNLFKELIKTFNSTLASEYINLSLCFDDYSKILLTNYSCDRIKMKEVFFNIIKNAFEAMGKQKGEISITCNKNNILTLPNGMSYLPIDISNNGAAIPEDLLNTIFKPYITYKENGTGMGLSICQKIIQNHGGLIRVSSNEVLTTFTILLPLKKET